MVGYRGNIRRCKNRQKILESIAKYNDCYSNIRSESIKSKMADQK